MTKTALRLQKQEATVPVAELAALSKHWLLSCSVSQHSEQTLSLRRVVTSKLLWFLTREGYPECGRHEMRAFLGYLGTGHKEPGGRFGNPQLTTAPRPRTVKDYFTCLRTFFLWCVAEGEIDASPLSGIPVPVSRADQIQPLAFEQVQALLAAARKSTHPKRDEVICLMLLDTGMRASELCALCVGDLDLTGGTCTVQGKGNKTRPVFFGKDVQKAVYKYLRAEPKDDDAPLFVSGRGVGAGEALTRFGLSQLVERLGKAAALRNVRCSPHTLRHTFAVSFLRNGGQQFALMRMLGHTNIQMTARYVALATADVERQHRAFSPVDGMRKGAKK